MFFLLLLLSHQSSLEIESSSTTSEELSDLSTKKQFKGSLKIHYEHNLEISSVVEIVKNLLTSGDNTGIEREFANINELSSLFSCSYSHLIQITCKIQNFVLHLYNQKETRNESEMRTPIYISDTCLTLYKEFFRKIGLKCLRIAIFDCISSYNWKLLFEFIDSHGSITSLYIKNYIEDSHTPQVQVPYELIDIKSSVGLCNIEMINLVIPMQVLAGLNNLELKCLRLVKCEIQLPPSKISSDIVIGILSDSFRTVHFVDCCITKNSSKKIISSKISTFDFNCLSKCINLVDLCILYIDCSLINLRYDHLKHLKKLTICVKNIGCRNLDMLAPCTRLKYLSIITSDMEATLGILRNINLQELQFFGLKTTETFMKTLASDIVLDFPTLEVFKFVAPSHKLTSRYRPLFNVKSMSNLKKLSITCESIDISVVQGICEFSELKSFNISLDARNNVLFEEISNNCCFKKSLCKLCLNAEITRITFTKVVASFVNLEELALSNDTIQYLCNHKTTVRGFINSFKSDLSQLFNTKIPEIPKLKRLICNDVLDLTTVKKFLLENKIIFAPYLLELNITMLIPGIFTANSATNSYAMSQSDQFGSSHHKSKNMVKLLKMLFKRYKRMKKITVELDNYGKFTPEDIRKFEATYFDKVRGVRKIQYRSEDYENDRIIWEFKN
ncbi:hypothetical protein THOM_2389 [Trachipleistophora hominis]|uniref:LRR containing protein n=1 Tax=Trachipleistophora hominis TaxID=72359 RepID=L7JUI0_TRAHO|nr:hypothetical protein THOM_2389 [Trachipleistophora hominis]